MPEPATTDATLPTPADAPVPLPGDFDTLRFVDQVQLQSERGAREVRISRIDADGNEVEVFPHYPAGTFDTAFVARDHGQGVFKGYIYGPRGRRMAGTNTFRTEAPVSAAKPSEGNSAGVEAKLAAIQAELAQVKDAAGRRRTIADMTLEELRAVLPSPQAAPPAPRISLGDIITALPVLVGAWKTLRPRSNVEEVFGVMDAIEKRIGGKGGGGKSANDETATLSDLLRTPVIERLAAKFLGDDDAPGRPAAQAGAAAQLPAAPATAPGAAATTAQVETAPPADTPDAGTNDTVIKLTAGMLADALAKDPGLLPEDAAANIMEQTTPDAVADFLKPFQHGQLASALATAHAALANRVLWLVMIEGAVRLGTKAAMENVDPDDDDDDQGETPGGAQ